MATFSVLGSTFDLNDPFSLEEAVVTVPDGLHRVGDRVKIHTTDENSERDYDAVFIGYVIGDDGHFYPIFQPEFFSGGLYLLATNEPGSSYRANNIITDTPLGIGDVTFSNFGINSGGGQNQDGTGAYTLEGSEISLAHGVYSAGDQVVLTASDGRTWTGQFVGFENRTGNAIFWVPASGGEQAFSLILTNEPGTGSHTVPDGGVITDVAYVTDASYGLDGITFSEFGNHGSRQGDTDGPFALQGQSLTVPDGIHRVDDEVTIHVSGRAISTTYIGYDIGDDGQSRPIFRDDDGLHYIATDETGSGDYTPDNIVTDTPLKIGYAIFSNFGINSGGGQNQDGTGAYTLDGRELAIPHGVHRAGDDVVLTTGDRIWTGRFVGFENLTGNPIFRVPASGDQQAFSLIATNEPGRGSHTVPDGGVITDVAYETDGTYGADGITFSEFGNYGTRQGNTDGDFTLEGQSVTVPDGIHRVDDAVTIHVSGRAISTTYIGYDIGDDSQFRPIFRDDAGLHYIATDGTGSGDYTPGDIIAASFAVGEPGEATFANYGFRQGDLTGDFTLRGVGIDIPDDIYTPGETLTIQPFGGGGAVSVKFVGYVIDDGTNYPIFEAANFGGNGPAQFIGAGETGTGSYTPGQIITNTPLGVGFARFSALGARAEGGDIVDFTLNPLSADIETGIHMMNDIVMIRIDYGTTIGNFDMEFVGFESGTFYPIVRSGGVEYILTNEPPPPAGETGSYTPGNIVSGEYTTCFAPGTWIATPDGERPVETLGPGDKVLTAESCVANVKWVGVQKLPTMFGPPELTHPVRIMAGALDDNVPHTDLVVTKDHGMIVDGVICHAGALINGTSIVEVSPGELGKVATYYHVETENHVPLLANGAAAESFIDNVDRTRFNNHSEFVALYGSNVPAMTEMNMPRAMSARQVPRRVTLLLAERAAMILSSAVGGASAVRGSVARGAAARSA